MIYFLVAYAVVAILVLAKAIKASESILVRDIPGIAMCMTCWPLWAPILAVAFALDYLGRFKNVVVYRKKVSK